MQLLDDGHGAKGAKALTQLRERKQQLLALFVVGLCTGVVISERLYVARSKAVLAAAATAAASAPGAAGAAQQQQTLAAAGAAQQQQMLAAAGGGVQPAAAAAQAAAQAAAVPAAQALPDLPAGGGSSASAAVAAAVAALTAAVKAAEAAVAAATAEAAIAADPSLKALQDYLLKVAPGREVLVGVANVNPLREGMLDTFLYGVKQAGVAAYVIVALDTETATDLAARGFHAYHMPLTVSASQAGTGSNHAVSALKFGIIKKFLCLGWAVLLSDIDVVVLQDPFKHLHRDHDLEGMSDGFNSPTAYGTIEGYEDKSMGWARFAQKESHFNLNSGLFYVAANARTIELMERLASRLAVQKYWDQTAYNEEIFFLSHDTYRSPKVSVRVMGIHAFMNSKTLFKDVRHRPYLSTGLPVMVHINYHPDKHERMKAVLRYYLQKDTHALERFPGGSEPGT